MNSARILKLAEVYQTDFVWYESHSVYSSGYGEVRPGCTATSAEIHRADNGIAYEDDRMYGVSWRCWSSKPTKDQTKDAAWLDEKLEEIEE